MKPTEAKVGAKSKQPKAPCICLRGTSSVTLPGSSITPPPGAATMTVYPLPRGNFTGAGHNLRLWPAVCLGAVLVSAIVYFPAQAAAQGGRAVMERVHARKRPPAQAWDLRAVIRDETGREKEIALRGFETFREAGGSELHLVSSLNSSDTWANAAVSLVRQALASKQ